MNKFQKDDQVLCFHGPMLYEAKILKTNLEEGLYLVHYKGWKSKWDEWVREDRLKQLNDENLALQLQLKSKLSTNSSLNHSSSSLNGAGTGSEKKKKKTSSVSASCSSDENCDKQQITSSSSSSMLLSLPQRLIQILNEDHLEIVNGKKIIDLPLSSTVESILDKFCLQMQQQQQQQQQSSSSKSLPSPTLNQTVEGLKEYFDKALGLMLLYRFERQQYSDMFHSKDKPWKAPRYFYGFVHLIRLLCKIPPVSPSNDLPQDKLDGIKSDLELICNWLSQNADSFYNIYTDYIEPPASYVALAKQF